MNATDYAQIHACITRCTSELRGIASRLYVSDGATAELVSQAADELGKLIAALQPYREHELQTPIGD